MVRQEKSGNSARRCDRSAAHEEKSACGIWRFEDLKGLFDLVMKNANRENNKYKNTTST